MPLSDAEELELERERAKARTSVAIDKETMPKMGPIEDTAWSTLTGLRKGITSDLPGMIGDVQDMSRRAIKGVTGFDPINVPSVGPVSTLLGAGPKVPGSADIEGGIQRSGLMPEILSHDPQTTWGEYGQEAGRFAPNFIGGPATAARGALAKYGTRLGTRVLGPAIATQSVGDLADKYLPESVAPYVKTGAALLSGGVGGMAEHLALAPGLRAAKEGVAGRATPTQEALLKKSDEQYEQFRGVDLRIKPSTIRKMGSTIEKELWDKGKRPEKAPDTYAEIERLKNWPRNRPMDPADWQSSQQSFKDTAYGGKGTDRAAGAQAMRIFDRHFSTEFTPQDLASGDITSLMMGRELLNRANGNYAAFKRSQTVSRTIDKAKRQAGSTFSGRNLDNTMRSKMRQLTDREVDRRVLGLNPEEFSQMEQVSQGTPAINRLRTIGNLGGGGLGVASGMMGGGGIGAAFYLNPKFALLGAIPASGYAARSAANRATVRAAHAFEEQLRRRSPLAEEMPRPRVGTPKDELWQRALLLWQLQQANQGQSPGVGP